MGTNPVSPLEALGKRVAALRRKRGMTAATLADKLTELGVTWDRGGLAKLETGRRRTVTIEDVFALAIALNVSPLTLLFPEDEATTYAVTPTTAATTTEAGMWLSGTKPLEVGSSENPFDQAWLAWMAELPTWKRDERAEALQEVLTQLTKIRKPNEGSEDGDQTD